MNSNAITESCAPSHVRRLGVLAYGGLCYLFFLATFLYAIGFVGNFAVPKSIDSGPDAPPIRAAVVDVLLLGLFAVQHSVMARPWYKRWSAAAVPPSVERSTYVLASSVALIVLYWLWRPLPGVVWEVRHPAAAAALWALFGVGWAVVLIATFQIGHFDLFGLRQVALYTQCRPYEPPPFREPALYRAVRHPIMLGFVVAFWSTPVMTLGHLLFAVTTTAYIVVGVRFEERDLVGAHGASYEAYRRRVPMVFPWPRP